MKLYYYRDKKHTKRCILLDEDGVIVQEVWDFMRYEQNVGKTPNTLLTYGCRLELWYTYLETIGIDALQIDQVKAQLSLFSDYVSCLRGKEYSSRTIELSLSVVFLFYEYLRSDEIIEFKLSDKLKHQFIQHNKGMLGEMSRSGHSVIDMSKIYHPSSTKKNEIMYITREEYNRLIGACCNVRDKVLIGLLFECGMRIGEALGVHISDIQPEDNHVVIVPRQDNLNDAYVKRQAGRTATCPDSIVNWITYLLVSDDYSSFDSDYLFVVLDGKHKGEPLSYRAAYANLKKIAKRAGLPDFHPHMGRHGFAMERLNEGNYRIEEVQQALGHQSMESTKIYAQYTSEHMDEVAKKFYADRDLNFKISNQTEKGAEDDEK